MILTYSVRTIGRISREVAAAIADEATFVRTQISPSYHSPRWREPEMARRKSLDAERLRNKYFKVPTWIAL